MNEKTSLHVASTYTISEVSNGSSQNRKLSVKKIWYQVIELVLFPTKGRHLIVYRLLIIGSGRRRAQRETDILKPIVAQRCPVATLNRRISRTGALPSYESGGLAPQVLRVDYIRLVTSSDQRRDFYKLEKVSRSSR
jgi:hypothetical protein